MERRRSVDPRDFLELGVDLARRQSLAEIRTGVSRIYYANHLLAVARATSQWGYQPRGSGDDHRGVIRFMKYERRGKFQSPAQKLLGLLEARAHADYHMSKTPDMNCVYCNTSADDCEFDGEQIEMLLKDAEALFRQLTIL
jgi:hypothetical protein